MKQISVIIAGYEADQLTVEAQEALRSSARVILHTERCGCAAWLREGGIPYDSLDGLYEEFDDFDQHARAAAEAIGKAAELTDVCYVVLTDRDRSIAELRRCVPEKLRIIIGPDLAQGLLAGVCTGVLDISASEWEEAVFSSAQGTLIRELNERAVASELKLRLMDVYPEEEKIRVLQGNGTIQEVFLYDLDRLDRYDHRTMAFIPAVPDFLDLERFDFQRFEEIIRTLLGPNGCPWDRAQTHRSLRPYVLEEAYETVDAIDQEEPEHLCEELGDLLLQIVLHAGIAEKHGDFGMNDITTAIARKMIRRHTHVFAHEAAGDARSVADLWSRNKMEERNQKTQSERLRDIPGALPSILRAVKVAKRAGEACEREYEEDKVRADLLGQLEGGEDAEQALGSALFDLAVLCLLKKVDPEIALKKRLDRIVRRFGTLEAEGHSGRELWDGLWNAGEE